MRGVVPSLKGESGNVVVSSKSIEEEMMVSAPVEESMENAEE